MLPVSDANVEAAIEGEELALSGDEDVEEISRCMDDATAIVLEAMSVIVLSPAYRIGLSRGVGLPVRARLRRRVNVLSEEPTI